MALYSGYQGATRCTSGPTPGARALMAWFLGAYQSRGGRNLGIYNCRAVRGGSTTSLHGEGRACDFGINPHGAAYGSQLADQLRLNSAALGIQCIIWNRRIWSGSYPTAGWRRYTGVNPHVDHLHVELSWSAANGLTAARAAQILSGGARPPAAQPVAPVKKVKPVIIEKPLVKGPNYLRIPAMVGAASGLYARAWVSISGELGGDMTVAFQKNAAADGPPPGAGAVWGPTVFRNASRVWKEIPSGTEYLEVWVTLKGRTGFVAVEFDPK